MYDVITLPKTVQFTQELDSLYVQRPSYCWEVLETPYVQEVYRQTDGEDNAYERTYTRAQTEVA